MVDEIILCLHGLDLWINAHFFPLLNAIMKVLKLIFESVVNNFETFSEFIDDAFRILLMTF